MARKEKTELEIAREHYKMWLEAEEEIALDQAYSIGSQSLTRADLGKVAQRWKSWKRARAAAAFIRLSPRIAKGGAECERIGQGNSRRCAAMGRKAGRGATAVANSQ